MNPRHTFPICPPKSWEGGNAIFDKSNFVCVNPFCGRHRNRRGFTLVELLSTISVIAVLAAMVLPTVGGLERKANVSKCTANLRQLGTATLAYAAENNGRLPEAPPYAWRTYRWDGWCVMKALHPYAQDVRIFFCPANTVVSYKNMPDPGVLNWSDPPVGWNVQWGYQALFRGEPLTSFSSRGAGNGVGSETPIIWDSAYPGWGDGVSDCNHKTKNTCSGANWLFADGHVTWATRETEPLWGNYGE
jgi:prepilin-type N-terminal cleavage/methylation domain-containing protein/prepilin-type processing-associated H-X9-DG protein